MATEIRTRMIGRCRRSSATEKLASGLSACQLCDVFEEIYKVSNGFLNRPVIVAVDDTAIIFFEFALECVVQWERIIQQVASSLLCTKTSDDDLLTRLHPDDYEASGNALRFFIEKMSDLSFVQGLIHHNMRVLTNKALKIVEHLPEHFPAKFVTERNSFRNVFCVVRILAKYPLFNFIYIVVRKTEMASQPLRNCGFPGAYDATYEYDHCALPKKISS